MRESSGGCAAYPPIADYAIVGDCHTAALIARDGSVDWLCPGRFDAPAVFCRLVDEKQGGCLALRPAGAFSSRRAYRGPTNILETVLATASGRVRLTDFMPVHAGVPTRRGQDVRASHRLLRLVEGLDGTVDLVLRFRPTFDFGRVRTVLQRVQDDGALAQAGDQYLLLSCAGAVLAGGPTGEVTGEVRVAAGGRRWLVLTYGSGAPPTGQPLSEEDCQALLEQTLRYWKRWGDSCTYRGPYRETVLRSALTLKLLTYEPTGAVVAAPTTSLPEEIGGARNWDYRYTWLRDASLILYSLMTIGYQAEATDFVHWLRRTLRADPTAAPQIMYSIDGRRHLPEIALDNLDGYCGSRPVRVGNAASKQFQLDIYGELLTAAYLHYRGRKGRGPARPAGRPSPRPPTPGTWALLRGLVEQAAEHWREPDYGIWEVRGGPQLFLYSRLMCWAALDRGIRLATEYGLPGPLVRWNETRQAIHEAILTHGYNREVGAFTQAFGSTALDASALAIPRVGLLPATDPRFLSTIKAIQERLERNDLVYRYLTPDGLPGGEGAFAVCTFWLVDALALSGQLDEAHHLFERTIGYLNDVGLISEEIDPRTGGLLGNFPQGFTHLAIIRSAVDLAKTAKHGPEEQSETEAERAHRARRAASHGYDRVTGAKKT